MFREPKWSPFRIKSSHQGKPELVPADEHRATAQSPEVLQYLEIVIGLDCVPNDGPQPLESLLVRLHVSRNLILAVEVEGVPLDPFHDILNADAIAVEESILSLGEAMTELRRQRGGSVGFGGAGGLGADCPQREGFQPGESRES